MIKPYYKDDWCTIYNADCKEILPWIEKVDLVLTDPPYGLNKKMSGGTWGNSQKYKDMFNWDFIPDNEVFRLIFEKGENFIIWGGNYFNLKPSRCWYVWDKQNAVPTCADCELAWTSYDKPVKRVSLPVGVHSLGHPTQKPIRLFKWCISISLQAKTILDPFMGSGTTLRAAKDLNIKSIGIEIEEKYCEIAAQRLQQEVLNFDM